ncbi:MAG: Unknown protein [uncultured Thiotrichaceae bacterium]|uniref:Protein SlyX homolog n=1 Tax=uncultured Thiotrichaceae bacterium TaxID=298394 RepID=A0A6S6TE64_9GAMM|nr:MAG: Unknown protein [uncultured Thiotrichaceae bacterium]
MSEERLAHLEMLIMEHEQTIDSLSDTIHLQQLTIQSLQRELDKFEARLTSLQSSPIRAPEDDVPPPHY